MSLSMQAQIQRTFMGQTLGVSTKAEVIDALDDKGAFPSHLNGEDVICIKDIRLGGHSWGMITFVFYNDILLTVLLGETESYLDPDLCEQKWKNIVNKLDSKYSDFKIDDEDKLKSYRDNYTILIVSRKTGTVAMGYTDYQLGTKKKNEESDEL